MRVPAVSVVMSVFDSAPVLSDAIESILAQTERNFEFIIIDDGSRDGSSEILQRYAAADSRIRLVRQANQGLTRALITGCAMARGEFIARQDSDDISMPTRLERLLGLLRGDPALAFVSSFSEVIGPAGETLLVHRRPADAADARELLLSRREGPPGHGSVMFRKVAYDRVGGYRPEMYFAQDSDLWLRLIAVGGLQYVQEVLYRYRVAPESISGRLQPVKVAFAQTVTELHEARLAGRDEGPILARAANLRKAPAAAGSRGATSEAQTSYFIARCLIRQRDPRALSYLRRSIGEQWFNPRAWASLPQAMMLRLRSR